tara:strand:- start:251 stop:457 length:207 start_codon:yes stop_codon:yes gene_type:complete
MKSKIKIGDLVYVPSDVTLFNESETYKLKKPINLLITGKKDSYYEVLYNGNPWYIENSNVYVLKEKIC